MDRATQWRARRAITRLSVLWVNPGLQPEPNCTTFSPFKAQIPYTPPTHESQHSIGHPIKTLLPLLLTTLILGCSSNSATVEKSWVKNDIQTKADLRGVLVVTAATSESGRRAFEQEFTQALQDQGIHAVASYTLKDGTEITREDVVAMAEKADLDTVMVTLFAGRDENAVLHPGRKYYGVAPVYGGGYYGRGRVYGVPYQVGQTSDFWAEHKSIHLTAKLYEIKTEERLWQVNSGMEETDDVAKMRSAFIRSFMQDLANQGLVN